MQTHMRWIYTVALAVLVSNACTGPTGPEVDAVISAEYRYYLLGWNRIYGKVLEHGTDYPIGNVPVVINVQGMIPEVVDKYKLAEWFHEYTTGGYTPDWSGQFSINVPIGYKIENWFDGRLQFSDERYFWYVVTVNIEDGSPGYPAVTVDQQYIGWGGNVRELKEDFELITRLRRRPGS